MKGNCKLCFTFVSLEALFSSNDGPTSILWKAVNMKYLSLLFCLHLANATDLADGWGMQMKGLENVYVMTFQMLNYIYNN